MATIEKLTPGQIVYSVESVRMGNTTIKRKALYEVRIIENHLTYVLASWNGNKPQRFYNSAVKRWRVKKPQPKGEIFGHKTY